MATGNQNSPKGPRRKDDDELNYDSIAGSDVPVDRHDVVVPGDTARYLEQPDFASAPPPKETGGLGRRAADDPEVGKDAAADAQLQTGTPGARNFEGDGAGRRRSGDSDDQSAGGRSGQGEGLAGQEFAEGDLGPFATGQGSPRPFLETLEDESAGEAVEGLRNGSGQGGLVDGLLNTVTGLVNDVVDTVTGIVDEVVPTVLNAVGLAISESSVLGTVVATLSATGTNAGSMVYSILNDPTGNFLIVGDKIILSPAANLDFESATSHDVVVRGVDAAGDIVTQTFTIEVTDTDEFNVTPVTDGDLAADIVSEDAAAGDTIGVVASAVDGDGSDTVSFAVDDPRFTVDPDGTVRVADGASFDAETEPAITITVTATSSDGSSSNQSFTVAVGDVNEAAIGALSDADAAGNTVLENLAVGSVVGITASAVDADAGDTVTYSLNDDAGGLFAIDANTGVVTVAGAIDREIAASYDIEVLATSSDGSTSTQTYTISIDDQNEFSVSAPTDANAGVNAITENVAVGTVVGITAVATDGDATNNGVTYSLSDDAGGLFAIDANTGVVTVAGALNAELALSHTIEVTATSQDGSTATQTFSIAVNDFNETAISAISDANIAANSVSEAAAIGSSVGVIALATDPDITDSVTYSLSSNPGGFFSIDANTGVVTVANSLDYESAAQHTIEVTATSTDGSTSTQTFTIDVTDANESGVGAVSDTDGAANAVNENVAIGSTVGITAAAADADGSDTVTYSLSDDAGGLFAIDANMGVVTVAGAIDRETAASYDIEVTATSSDGSTSAQTYTIAINDQDEFDISTPVDADAAANSVVEGAANGSVVGVTASAADADATNNSVTYSLVDGGGNPVAGGPFAVDANSGVVTVADGSQLDYESATSHTIYVKATSADGSESTESFVINVTDQNESGVSGVSDSDAGANAVDENSAIGTTVGIIAMASDADGSDTVTYSLSDDAGGLFAIDANTGVVTVAGAIDREAAASYDIEVTATSSDGSTSTQTYTINVNDIDEFDVSTPTDSNAAANSVVEGAANGTVVGVTASATDGDATNNGVTYSLVDGSGNPVAGGPFAVDANSGVVTVADGSQLDYESATNHTIYVKATSADGSESTESFVINVTDANESGVGAVSDSDGAANAVDENVAVGTTVGITAFAADADGTDTVTYSLSNDAGGLFAIDANTGVVTVAGAIDREAAASHDIEVTATSSDGSTSTQTYTIDVNDIDEFDVTTPTDSFGPANTVSESYANGSAVGIIASASDGDATNSAVTYSIVDLNGDPVVNGPFAIDANSGFVSIADATQIDYETATSHTLYVKATSEDGSESTQSFIINVTDADEVDVGAISDSDGAANAVDENVAVGTTVGITASASDADGTDTVTYSLSNDAGGLFAIDANTGVVTVAGAIDREAAASYDIEVTATSSDGSTSAQSYTINVNDIDEFDVSTPTDSDVAANTIVDDAANGTVVGVTASAVDGDATNNGVTYSLVDGSGNPVAGGPFAIDANSGVVTVADNTQLDFDIASSQTIYVKATSADGSEATQSFVIDVTSGNEAPTDIQFTSGNSYDSSGVLSLNQDGSMGQYAQVQNFDDFPTDALSIEMVIQGGHTGEESADMPIFSYAVPGNSDEVSVLILDDGRIEVEIDGTTVQSAAGVGDGFLDGDEHRFSLTWDSVTGDLKVYQDGVEIYTDNLSQGGTIDQGGTLMLGQEQDSFEGGLASHQQLIGTIDDVRIFNDVRTQTEIANNAAAQFADPSSVTGLVSNFTFDTVNDTQVNDAAGTNTMTLEGGATVERFAVNEDAAAGTVVATLNTVDADSGDTHNYTITNDPSNSFEIVGNEIRVKTGASLDFESQSSYELTVQSTDDSGDSVSETITIDITNVFDEGPTNINFTGNGDLALSGGSGGGLVLNDGGATNEYAVVSNFAGFTTADLTFEMSFSMQPAAHEQTLVSYATSGQANEFTVIYHTNHTLEVLLDGDSIILNPGIDLADGSRHTISLVYEDLDNEMWLYVDGSIASYSNAISGGTTLSSGGTMIFGQEQDTLGGGFNANQIFEGEIYEARVWDDKRTATEISNNWDTLLSNPGSAGNLISNWQFENGSTNDLRGSNHMTLHNGASVETAGGTIPAGSVVANIASVVDADAGDHFTYALTDDAGGKFTIDADSGEISLVAEHDAFSVYSDTVTVQVTDAGGNSFSEVLGIQLGNNDAQTINGTSNDDVMYGFGGQDTLNGGAGDDTLYGDSGDHSGPSLILNSSGTDDVAHVSNMTDFPTSTLSAEVSFAADSIPGVDATLLSYYSNSSPDAFTLYMRTSPDDISVEFGNTIYSTGVSASALLDGADHTISVTWDSATGALNLYVDGVSQYSGTIAQGYTIPTGGTLSIGQEQDSLGGGYDSNQAFAGTIGEVRIFDDVRTAQEIADNHDRLLADPTNEQGLVSNWQFNTDEGSTVTDLAGNNDLTLSNGASVGWPDASNNDTLNGGDGNDTLVGGAGADVLDGGAGMDTVDYSDSEGGVTVLLEATDAHGIGNAEYQNAAAGGHGGEAEGDSYVSIESVVGSDYNDSVYGSSSGTSAFLGAGDDVFDNAGASTGMDYVEGGAGNDTVWTGGGNDWIIGGEGNDTLHGEDGSDMFTFRMGDGNDIVNGGAGAGWTDTIQLHDELGGNNLGTYGTDWTITLTEGSITGSDDNSFTLSDDADGTINLSDGSSVQFFDIERIEF